MLLLANITRVKIIRYMYSACVNIVFIDLQRYLLFMLNVIMFIITYNCNWRKQNSAPIFHLRIRDDDP